MLSLKRVNDGRVETQSRKRCTDMLNDKETTSIVSLGIVSGIIVKKVTCTIQDRFRPIDLNASHNVSRMPENHISTSIN
jgi:hypothetical protein